MFNNFTLNTLTIFELIIRDASLSASSNLIQNFTFTLTIRFRNYSNDLEIKLCD